MRALILSFSLLLVSAAAAASESQALILPAGSELSLLSINPVQVDLGQQVQVLMKPQIEGESAVVLPEYCIISARFSLSAERGLLSASSLFCVTDAKQVLRAEVSGLILDSEQSTVAVDCTSPQAAGCAQARLAANREFKLRLDQDVELLP